MKKVLLFIISMWMFSSSATNAQAVQFPTMDLYDTDVMMMPLNAVREMNQRAIQISQTVQPYREQQRQYYREGKYREAVELCYDVRQQYVYYVHDNKAISDMEIVAGDCALRIGAYESAIDWFQTAKGAGESGMDSRLSQVFNAVMQKARDAYKSNNYSDLWNDVTIALKTGWESGECYYYYGVCYERSYNLRDAKNKLAKKKNYALAVVALKNLKKRR